MNSDQEKRGARLVDVNIIREIIDGAGDPAYRLKTADVSSYTLACALIEYVDLNSDKFRTIQAYCKAADEDKAAIRDLRDALHAAWPWLLWAKERGALNEPAINEVKDTLCKTAETAKP